MSLCCFVIRLLELLPLVVQEPTQITPVKPLPTAAVRPNVHRPKKYAQVLYDYQGTQPEDLDIVKVMLAEP